MTREAITGERLTGWQAGVVWAVVGLELALACVGALLVPEQPDVPLWARGVFGLLIASLGGVGALIATRQPRNAIGWILWMAALLVAFAMTGDDYATYSVVVLDGTLPATDWVAWFGSLTALPGIIAVLVFVPLLFPDGHVLTPRWRWVVALSVVATVMDVLPPAFRPGLLDTAEALKNPVGLESAATFIEVLDAANIVSFAIVLPLAIASVVLRYRRGTATEREQLKWFAAAVFLTGACFALAVVQVGPLSDFGWIAGIITLSLVPIAIGIAILRYRLYEIDRIISRTLSYVIVTVTLVVVFAGAVLGLQELLAPLTGENTVAVAASTLMVAALFQPLRRQVQQVVDRRFNRARYDAQRMAEAFSERLRDEVEITAVTDDLDATIRSALGPAMVALWVRGPAK